MNSRSRITGGEKSSGVVVARRSVLTAGAGAAAGIAIQPLHAEASAPARIAQATPRRQVRQAYTRAVRRAGGSWHACISVGEAGRAAISVEHDVDAVVEAYSVNKIAVAATVLSAVDSGSLSLTDRVEVTEDITVPEGDGVFVLDQAYPSSVTLGHVLAAMLTISDDIAVRLCGLVVTAEQINTLMRRWGFPNTQVEPKPGTRRFFLGKTTARETHDLLLRIVRRELLSDTSTRRILDLTRSAIAFTDGMRLHLPTAHRMQVSTKAGWLDDGRNEAGIIYGPTGAPTIVYSMFATKPGNNTDYGATHPLVKARAAMGRPFFDAAQRATPTTGSTRVRPLTQRPSNGG